MFITGASSGLGYEFTKKALDLGDKVVGVARNIEKLNELKSQFEGMLLPLRLDVTNRSDVFRSSSNLRVLQLIRLFQNEQLLVLKPR